MASAGLIKLGLSEKCTKFEKIFLMVVLTNQLIYLISVKTMRKIFSNDVCISKSPLHIDQKVSKKAWPHNNSCTNKTVLENFCPKFLLRLAYWLKLGISFKTKKMLKASLPFLRNSKEHNCKKIILKSHLHTFF